MEKMASGGPKWGREDFFPTNPDLADILGRTDLDFEIFYLILCLLLDANILNFQVPKSQKIWISRSPDLQIPKIPDFQVPRFPDAATGGGGAGRILRSQPDPSPNAPRDQMRRKGLAAIMRLPRSELSKGNPLDAPLLL